MKILFTVEFYEPRKGGAEEAVRQLAERLVKRGHEVVVATTFLLNRISNVINGVKIESFHLSGTMLRGIKGSGEEIRRYQDFLRGDFDAVINYAAQIWTTDLAFEVLDKIRGKKYLVPCGLPAMRNPRYGHYFNILPKAMARYDKLIYMSPNYQDKLFGDDHGLANKAVIIPNGAAAEEFLVESGFNVRKYVSINSKYLAICVANHYRDKGHDFVIRAFLNMNRNDTTLLIVGQNPGNTLLGKTRQFFTGCYKSCLLSSLVHSNIRLMAGNDREKVLAAYKQADLFLFGSKVECAPLVMYESFASKTLFITTSAGNIPDHREEAVVVLDPAEMAERTSYYLDHPVEVRTRTNRAFDLWQQHYTWDKIVEQYQQLILS